MTKKITLTMRDWVYDNYFSSIKGNKSAIIEEALIKLIESSSKEEDSKTRKIVELSTQNREFQAEIRNLRGNIEKNRGIIEKTQHDQAILNSPIHKCVKCNAQIEGKPKEVKKGHYACSPCYYNASYEDFQKWDKLEEIKNTQND